MSDSAHTAMLTLPTADEAVAHTLLNCLLREISGPEHQTAIVDGNLLLRMPRRDVLLRIALRRTSLLGAHRFTGPVERRADTTWHPIDWQLLATLVRDELGLRSGLWNDEFLEQMESAHAGVSRGLSAGMPVHHDAFRSSEQSLVFGHRFHPTPKARSGTAGDWSAYAPEAGAEFPLRHLAVRTPLVVEEYVDPADLIALDRHRPGNLPAGYTFLPAHPWQWELTRDRPAIRRALEDGDLLDLGAGSDEVWPTSSVRTVHDGHAFLKFSLDVRITNCLRKNAAYELTGAVALTRRLAPVAEDLADRFPGATLLREPAYRSVSLGEDLEALEALAVIVREGLDPAAPGTRVLLAAAVADEYPTSSAHLSRLLPGATPGQLLAWWSAYLRLLVGPVVAAYSDHGVVLEPHLQNVLVGVDDDGMPVRVLLRDLEGTKLVPDHAENATFLASLPASVAGPMTYDAQRGWDRVVYCLVVNHIAEVLAAIADLAPEIEARLWREVRVVMLECAERHPDDVRLRALLAGVPLPAKANLFARWERLADRDAGYLRLASPLAEGFLSGLLDDSGTQR
ncbi:IucA/IucC family siderophore biosynthesis protein [Nocardioides sp.]|uniref:IucA/IucC family protein n=1 Tax=Nocardioides sp. TaxID=35761 RepID=UPI003563F9C6